MTHHKKVLNLAVSTGEAMLKNGGEIYRVQDTMTHILEAYGISNYHVYVVSNGIFSTIDDGNEDAFSLVRYVPLGNVNLARISAINALSREICEKHLPLEEAYDKLKQCNTVPESTSAMKILACGVGAGAFCYLFGGSLLDSLFALCLGFVLQIFLNYASRVNTSRFFMNIIGSALVTCGSILLHIANLPISVSHVIIGSIIPLVPGVIFTTSIRDFFNGDHLSGTIHLIDAVLTSICIAVGVGAVIVCYHYFGGGEIFL
jgi:uncharacterized membrane protein YjjP (DUF1212 family)